MLDLLTMEPVTDCTDLWEEPQKQKVWILVQPSGGTVYPVVGKACPGPRCGGSMC